MSRADLDTVDAILQQHVKGVVDEVRSELGDRLSAVILHGSLAMGTFYAPPGKEEAGIWAISHLPGELRDIVAQALAAYRGSDWLHTIRERQLSGGPWRRTSLINFRDQCAPGTELRNAPERQRGSEQKCRADFSLADFEQPEYIWIARALFCRLWSFS